ncbi:hypothetical protein HDU96_005426 [Phlyctochytrium bullatum]|nr:hypothetical protein HDU96_005426 [Phlyctochytrium bullatum]
MPPPSPSSTSLTALLLLAIALPNACAQDPSSSASASVIASTTTTTAAASSTAAAPAAQATLVQFPDAPATTITDSAGYLNSILRIPGGCLFHDAELAGNPSRDLAALWIRNVFHDAGTFDAATGIGGADGSLESNEELVLPDNTGIAKSMPTRMLRRAANISATALSDADKIALAGIVAVRHCGGPNIPFRAGRGDSSPKSIINDYSLLPSDPFDSLANITAKFARMGLNKVDMLVLVAGSHSLGGAHRQVTPKVTSEVFVPFDDTPGVFDNGPFTRILQNRCVLQSDCAFGRDPDLLPLIATYASNQTAFFEQYAISFQKMMGLTRSRLADPLALAVDVHANLAAEGGIDAMRRGLGLPPLSTSAAATATTSYLATTMTAATTSVRATAGAAGVRWGWVAGVGVVAAVAAVV